MISRFKNIVVTIIFTLHVFTNYAHEWPANGKTVTFGLCNCEPNGSGSNLLKLSISSDSTFIYIDNSDPKNIIRVTGNWKVKGKKLNLISINEKISFHDKWKFDSKKQCIKARLELNFARICSLGYLEVE